MGSGVGTGSKWKGGRKRKEVLRLNKSREKPWSAKEREKDSFFREKGG